MRIFLAILLVLALVPLAVVLLDFRDGSLRSMYNRDVRAALIGDAAAPLLAPLVTEADLAPLPAPLRTYLRRAGVVGKPRVWSFHAVFSADMRGGPDEPWMRARADQYEFFHPMERLYFMKASRGGVPFDVLHRFAGDQARMTVRVAGLVPVQELAGRQMTQSETVTLFNDMCLLAPATLPNAPIVWEQLDDHSLRGTFEHAGHRVSAVLTFDASGDLADFRSEDRYKAEGDSMRRLPWTTPVSDYRDFGGARLAARGEARGTEGPRSWAYGRFVLERIAYNVQGSQPMAVLPAGGLP